MKGAQWGHAVQRVLTRGHSGSETPDRRLLDLWDPSGYRRAPQGISFEFRVEDLGLTLTLTRTPKTLPGLPHSAEALAVDVRERAISFFRIFILRILEAHKSKSPRSPEKLRLSAHVGQHARPGALGPRTEQQIPRESLQDSRIRCRRTWHSASRCGGMRPVDWNQLMRSVPHTLAPPFVP